MINVNPDELTKKDIWTLFKRDQHREGCGFSNLIGRIASHSFGEIEYYWIHKDDFVIDQLMEIASPFYGQNAWDRQKWEDRLNESNIIIGYDTRSKVSTSTPVSYIMFSKPKIVNGEEVVQLRAISSNLLNEDRSMSFKHGMLEKFINDQIAIGRRIVIDIPHFESSSGKFKYAENVVNFFRDLGFSPYESKQNLETTLENMSEKNTQSIHMQDGRYVFKSASGPRMNRELLFLNSKNYGIEDEFAFLQKQKRIIDTYLDSLEDDNEYAVTVLNEMFAHRVNDFVEQRKKTNPLKTIGLQPVDSREVHFEEYVPRTLELYEKIVKRASAFHETMEKITELNPFTIKPYERTRIRAYAQALA